MNNNQRECLEAALREARRQRYAAEAERGLTVETLKSVTEERDTARRVARLLEERIDRLLEERIDHRLPEPEPAASALARIEAVLKEIVAAVKPPQIVNIRSRDPLPPEAARFDNLKADQERKEQREIFQMIRQRELATDAWLIRIEDRLKRLEHSEQFPSPASMCSDLSRLEARIIQLEERLTPFPPTV